MSNCPATALIAEDEPLLAQSLQTELSRAWPELRVLATVGDGVSAVAQALQLKPDVLFFDIRMPGLSGLEAAAALADDWLPQDAFPFLVFVTAYDQYAVQAFETQAVDYLLKPVQPKRLQITIDKLRLALIKRAQAATISGADQNSSLEQTLAQLRHLLAATSPPAAHGSALKVIQVSVGSTIRMVPVGDVIYFEAADKYIRVLTTGHEYLIRLPLKELLRQLDMQSFWQIHRGTIVQAAAIDAVHRDESGKLSLSLRGRAERLLVSRLYAQQFRAL